MTKVLWITAEPPDLARSGGSIRQAHLLRALAAHAETHLLVAGHVEDRHAVAGLAGTTEVDAPGAGRTHGRAWWRMRRLSGALLESEPHETAAGRRLRRSLARGLAQLGNFDVTIVEHTWLAPIVDRGRSGLWMINLQQLATRQAEQGLRAARHARTRWLLSLELERARRMEAWIAGAYDRVFVSSPEDATAFAGAATVVPNGADLLAEQPRRDAAAGSATLLFVGHLAYRPNVLGLAWFCDHVLPRVRARRPATRLQVVGRQPVAEVLALGRRDGVSVEGEAPAMRSYLESAAAEVVPLMVGSGTRLKALEALAAGVPVVGTSVGLEGLGLVDGESALIADTAEEMANAILSLLDDPGRGVRLAAAGRALVEARFGWERIGSDFVEAVLRGGETVSAGAAGAGVAGGRRVG